jgi:hypothetical protein
MKATDVVVIVILAVAAAIAAFFALTKAKIGSIGQMLSVRNYSMSKDPRNWTISAEEAAKINSMTKEQQDQLAEQWKSYVELHPTESPEKAYHDLLKLV